MRTDDRYRRLLRGLILLAIGGAVGIAILTGGLVAPVVSGKHVASAEPTVQLPAYDYQPWHALVVQYRGRAKPMESAAVEIMREITGRGQFAGRDAVAIVLQWMMLQGTCTSEQFTDWETYPFILCDHHDLRRAIYGHLETAEQALTEAQLHGKFIAPADLRRSVGLRQLTEQAEELRSKYSSHDVPKMMAPLARKAEEVVGRLAVYDSISQNRLVVRSMQQQPFARDPLGVVALDRVHGGAWFSVGEARSIQLDPQNWEHAMLDRLARTPQLYLSPERQADLQQFQAEVKTGKAQRSLDDLATLLQARVAVQLEAVDALLRKFASAEDSAKDVLAGQMMAVCGDLVKSPRDWARLTPLLHAGSAGQPESAGPSLHQELHTIADRNIRELLEDLHHRVEQAAGLDYHPDDPRFKTLHFDYLENRFPNVYRESAAAQEVPRDAINQVVASYQQLQEAYRSGDGDWFNTATHDYFTALRETSERVDEYPGARTIALEMTFNRVQPFLWAWVLMFLAVLAFAGSILLNARACSILGFACYAGSMAFQLFGFYTRVTISGRPPVSNMYETVIWVAFMSGVFALILEAIYRCRTIILAGSVVATLGLVLADQLPMALDPKISPLTPVLRSNFWLTLHVLTIVSSYAGGTLAWGLANITLAMMAFGKGRKETLHTLSGFTYRAMQIAVLLLAAGTFLGGWWAAESWGRFWGWDPKEVWALIALVCYVIPLHARYLGWVKDFGLAVAAVLCYAAIVMCWYGVNFVLGAGLHSYGFGGGGPWWVFWAGLLNIEWVIVASILYLRKTRRPVIGRYEPTLELGPQELCEGLTGGCKAEVRT